MSAVPSSNLRLFAAETLHARLAALIAEIDGVRRAKDIEYVHRMRVASRRLRTALAVFTELLPAKKAAGWLRAIRRITRALGAARDADVQIAAIEAFAAAAEAPARPGLARLVLRLRQQRARQQTRVIAALDTLEASHTLTELEEMLRQLRVREHLQPVAPLPDPAPAALRTRVAELLSYEPYVTKPERVAELHALRIAAKRLRYTLELFAPRFADELKPFLKPARQLQELLGDIHDCDVWLDVLPRFLDDERRRMIAFAGHARGFSRLIPGIDALRADRAATRTTRYREFVTAWKAVRPVWDQLCAQMAGDEQSGEV